VIEIRVPKLNNNDTAYLLVEWLAKDGQAVRDGDPLAVLETSKAAEELAADGEGILRRLLPEGAECAPGQPIAQLRSPTDAPEPDAPEPDAPEALTEPPEPSPEPSPEPDTGGIVVTAPARRVMDARGITMDQVRTLGKKIVRAADLDALADAGVIELSRAQRRTAEVVEASHREIPAAYTVVKADVTEALRAARALTRELRVLIGVPELVIEALGGLLDRFPLFFATPVGGRAARPATAVHVGVTVDIGRGLFIPVVRDAGTRPLGDLARDLSAHRRTAMNGAFREDDLSGGTITLTLHTDDAVILAVPVVFPGQTCALALTAPQAEVVPQRDGELRVRKTVGLGLAYDHRFINGRDSAEFLGAIKTALEGRRHDGIAGGQD
jgi:2-oxoglutarate dehydrogenase E2 component (dihydrolipoamide succinyltransferase)